MTDWSFEAEQFRQAVWETAGWWSAPHTRMRPLIFPDGNAWCALYGRDLQEGVAGFGPTPAAACVDFDKNWNAQTLKGAQGDDTPHVISTGADTPHVISTGAEK